MKKTILYIIITLQFLLINSCSNQPKQTELVMEQENFKLYKEYSNNPDSNCFFD